MKNKKTNLISISILFGLLIVFLLPLNVEAKQCGWYKNNNYPNSWMKGDPATVNPVQFKSKDMSKTKIIGTIGISFNDHKKKKCSYEWQSSMNSADERKVLSCCKKLFPNEGVNWVLCRGYSETNGGGCKQCGDYDEIKKCNLTYDYLPNEPGFITTWDCIKYDENWGWYYPPVPPPSCSINITSSSSRMPIMPGDSITVEWSSSEHATSVVSSENLNNTENLSGKITESPISRKTYSLTVTNNEGKQETCNATIRIQEPLPILTGPCQNLVPCGTSKNPEDCTLSHIFVMIQNIVNCLVFISTIICLLFIVIGGLLYIFSLGNPENLTKAKNTILWALGGLALVFLAWLIVNTVMYWMGVDQNFLMWSRIG